MPKKEYNAFISYSHQDGEEFAEELRQRITNHHRGREFTFWQDYDNLQYGHWSRQIEEAIDAIEFFIMIITPKALLSSNCKEEWMYARRRGVCILPVNGLPGKIKSDTSTLQNIIKQMPALHLLQGSCVLKT